MNEAETREDTGLNRNGLLSPGSAVSELGSPHRRHTSAAPSMRSNYSSGTTVGDNGDPVEGDFQIRRQKTFHAEIKLTRLDCLRGLLFGPDKIAQKAVTTLTTQADRPDDIMYDHELCPFFVTVTVWPRENPTAKRREEARCIFDTGCLQGNIVSVELAHRLGFIDFEAASSREREGGMTASGHTLAVEGAIHLTWHHSTSSKIFKDMRFLVSSNTACDMVVGARSIQKHKLMSPPNLMVQQSGVQDVIAPPDPEREKLDGNVAKHQGFVDTTTRELRKKLNTPSLVQRLEREKRALRIAELELEKYDLENGGEGRQNNANRETILHEIHRELDELTGQQTEPAGDTECEQTPKARRDGTTSGSKLNSQPTSEGLRQRPQK